MMCCVPAATGWVSSGGMQFGCQRMQDVGFQLLVDHCVYGFVIMVEQNFAG